MKIKQLSITILSMLLCVFAGSSCSDDKDNSYLLLDIEGNQIIFDGNTFMQQVKINSSSEWSVIKSSQVEWLNVTVHDDIAVFQVEANSVDKARTADLIFTNLEGINVPLKVIQETGDKSNLTVDKVGDIWKNYHEISLDILVTSDVKWFVDIEAENDWLKYNIEDDVESSSLIKLNFEKNMSKDTRFASLRIKSGNQQKNIKIIQRGKKGFEDVTHKFYMHYGTYPMLYSAMDLVTHDLPSMLMERREAIDRSKLNSNVKVVLDSDYPDSFIQEVKQINENNPDAIFSYATDDIRGQFGLAIFTQLGIDTCRVKVTLLPDGTASYINLYNGKFGKASDGEYVYNKTMQNIKEYYDSLLINPDYGKEITESKKTDNWYFAHVLARQSHVQYYIQDTDYLITENQYVESQKEFTNYIEKTPLEVLNSLSVDQKQKFYELVGFDPKPYVKLFGESPKPNLIILGTNTAAGHTSGAKQAKLVQEVIDMYGETYDIFFKAHPSDPAYINYETTFPGLKLIMPARMPFEVFTWALNDQLDAIGGFSTTTFLSMPSDKIKFIFANDVSSLNIVFQKMFNDRDDIAWIN